MCITGTACGVELEINHRVVSEIVAVVDLSGEIDAYTAPRLREYLIELINSGYVRLVLDVRKVQFFDSTGQGVPVGAFKRVLGKGGIVVFVASERIIKLFRINGLVKVFQIFEDIDTAVDSVSSGLLPIHPARRLGAPEPGWHWFPGRVYTSDESAAEAVEEGLNAVLDAFGMEAVFSFPPQLGSWFREFLLRMKDSTARPTRDEFLALMQRAIEQQTLDRPQAQIDITQSQAVAILLAALEKTPKGIVQVGSLLVVKVTETVYVRNLTQRELLYWERHPGLFRDPEMALQELQRADDRDVEGGEDIDRQKVS